MYKSDENELQITIHIKVHIGHKKIGQGIMNATFLIEVFWHHILAQVLGIEMSFKLGVTHTRASDSPPHCI